jgi:hypothetical protein
MGLGNEHKKRQLANIVEKDISENQKYGMMHGGDIEGNQNKIHLVSE